MLALMTRGLTVTLTRQRRDGLRNLEINDLNQQY
jgi:hypothetical protein